MTTENPTIIITRNQAIAKSYTYYFTGEKCNRGHISKRRVDNRNCIECSKIQKENYYENNQETVKEKSKIYREKNPEKLKQRQKELYYYQREFEPWKWIIHHARVRASQENLPCDLTLEWGEERWTGKCELSEIRFVLFPENGRSIYSPSIDRVIPKLGYMQHNCRFILHGINAFKGVDTDADLLYVAKAIVFNS